MKRLMFSALLLCGMSLPAMAAPIVGPTEFDGPRSWSITIINGQMRIFDGYGMEIIQDQGTQFVDDVVMQPVDDVVTQNVDDVVTQNFDQMVAQTFDNTVMQTFDNTVTQTFDDVTQTFGDMVTQTVDDIGTQAFDIDDLELLLMGIDTPGWRRPYAGLWTEPYLAMGNPMLQYCSVADWRAGGATTIKFAVDPTIDPCAIAMHEVPGATHFIRGAYPMHCPECSKVRLVCEQSGTLVVHGRGLLHSVLRAVRSRMYRWDTCLLQVTPGDGISALPITPVETDFLSFDK